VDLVQQGGREFFGGCNDAAFGGGVDLDGGDKKIGYQKAGGGSRYLDIPEDFLAHNRDILAEIFAEISGLIFSRVGELVMV
jgi:hypothetical protein